MGYNTGDDDDKRAALKGIVDFTKIQISLSTGTLVLSATFLKEFYREQVLELILAAWSMLVLSIAFGFLAMGQYISQFAESDLRPRRSALELFNLLQWTSLAVALILFFIFVAANVTEPEKPATNEQVPPSPSASAPLPLP